MKMRDLPKPQPHKGGRSLSHIRRRKRPTATITTVRTTALDHGGPTAGKQWPRTHVHFFGAGEGGRRLVEHRSKPRRVRGRIPLHTTLTRRGQVSLQGGVLHNVRVYLIQLGPAWCSRGGHSTSRPQVEGSGGSPTARSHALPAVATHAGLHPNTTVALTSPSAQVHSDTRSGPLRPPRRDNAGTRTSGFASLGPPWGTRGCCLRKGDNSQRPALTRGEVQPCISASTWRPRCATSKCGTNAEESRAAAADRARVQFRKRASVAKEQSPTYHVWQNCMVDCAHKVHSHNRMYNTIKPYNETDRGDPVPTRGVTAGSTAKRCTMHTPS
jgi:hypothetical protein